MSPLARKRKAISALKEQPRPGGSSVVPPHPGRPGRPQILGLAHPARRRAVTRRYDITVDRWDGEQECSFGTFGEWPLRERLKLALNFWRGAGCELCTAYREYAAADNHEMEHCPYWEEGPRALRMLRYLKEMSVRATPKQKQGAIDEPDDSPCKACSFPSKLCRSDAPRLAARDGTVADCENIEAARRAVAALLGFEGCLLTDTLWNAEWVKTDDPAEMQVWMAQQRETDRSYVPGIFTALDELYGSYRHLLADYKYRVELHPLGEKEDAAVALLPRCRDEPLGFFVEALDAQFLAKQQRLNVVKELIQESTWTAQRLRELEDDDDQQQEERTFELNDKKKSLDYVISTAREMRPVYLRLEEAQNRLLRFRDVCMVCKAIGKPSDHSIRACTNTVALKAHAELVQAERAVNFQLRLGCHRCGMPNLICSRWKMQNGDGQFRLIRVPGRCCFESVALETIYGIKYSYKLVWDQWVNRLQHLAVCWENQERISEYLCSKKKYEELGQEFSKLDSCNLLWEFEWMTQSLEEELSL